MKRDVIIPLAVVGVLGLMILPVPSFLLDSLLALNITISLAIMLTAMHVRKPLEFSVFPALLLVTTLFRLGLNVSSTRLILLHGHEGTSAAGNVIQTFGNFVVGGNYVVGLVVFLILIIINFVVITKGSGRIAEVSARFTLDALPGRQMSIDSDLAAGIMTQHQARARREELSQEADFYGAMDGANKFVRGDAIAGLIITGINIVGGLVIGVMDGGLSFGDAATTYTVLTIGDGLVSQIPSLVIATAAGLVVTRASDGQALGSQMLGQTLGNRRVLGTASGVVGSMAFIPGLPMIPFLALGVGLWVMRRSAPELDESGDSVGALPTDEDRAQAPTEEDELKRSLSVDPIAVEVGFALVPLALREQGGELLDRIIGLRKRFAQELGIVIPEVSLRDSGDLKSDEYQILIHGVVVGQGTLMARRLLAMGIGEESEEVQGIPTRDPVFGIPALWIDPDDREIAEIEGFTVSEPAAVMATHLTEIFRDYASDLVGRQELQDLIDIVATRSPKLVDDLIPGIVSMSEVHAVVRGLLSEGVSIRDLRNILEAIADAARTSKSLVHLMRVVRERIGSAIAQALKEHDGKLYAAFLDPGCESTLRGCLVKNDNDAALAPDLTTAQTLHGAVQQATEQLGLRGHRPVIVAPADLRYPLWKFAHRFFPQVSVVTHQELPARLEIVVLSTVTLSAGAGAGARHQPQDAAHAVM